MFLPLISLALADTAVEGSLRVGGRTAPESAIQVPSAWEGSLDPSGLSSVELRARLAGDAGAWASLELGGWGYAPDQDASLLTAGVDLGWGREGAGRTWRLAGRCDAQVFPWLSSATNERVELYGSAGRALSHGVLTGQLTAVDRRFVGEQALSTAELGGVLALDPGPWGVDLGLSAQANLAQDGALGGQLRSLERLRLRGKIWSLSLEHRLIGALAGDVEDETRAAFTPLGDYADDVDALSGGGFVQNRIGASGALTPGAWTLSLGGLARFRAAEAEEEAAVGFVRALSAQARVQRALGPRADLYLAGGLAGAALGGGGGYQDTYGWLGLDLRASPGRRQEGATPAAESSRSR